MTLTQEQSDFCQRLLEEAGRNKTLNAAFAKWNAYPWDAPCVPGLIAPGTTPEELGEELLWPDRSIGVSASYLFYQEVDAWRILPLGDRLAVSLEEGHKGLTTQSGTLMTFVYVQIRAPGFQARVCMDDSGAVNAGGSMTESRRAFVAFVNSRTSG